MVSAALAPLELRQHLHHPVDHRNAVLQRGIGKAGLAAISSQDASLTFLPLRSYHALLNKPSSNMNKPANGSEACTGGPAMNHAEKRLADTAARLKQLYTAAVYDIMDAMGLPNQCLDLGIKPLDRDMRDRRAGLHHRLRGRHAAWTGNMTMRK